VGAAELAGWPGLRKSPGRGRNARSVFSNEGSTVSWTVADAVRRARRYLPLLGIRGAATAAVAVVTGRQAEVRLSRPFLSHPFWLRLPSSDLIVFRQLFGDREYRFPVAWPPRVIVDAGANIGLAALYFAHAFPRARVIAVEPAQSNVGLLQRNVAAYPSIEVVQAALWKENAELDLVDPGWGDWGFRTREHASEAGAAAAGATRRVRGMTVDALFDSCNVDHVDILKMDIEGAEVEVFEHAESWIRRVGMIVIELHDRVRPGCREAVSRAAAGFEHRWENGENVFFARASACAEPPAAGARLPARRSNAGC